ALPVRSVRTAVAAHVEGEDVEQRPKRQQTVDLRHGGFDSADRREFEKGPAGPGSEHVDARFDLVSRIFEDLTRVPVVSDLVVIPEDELRGLGIESAEVLVDEVVFPLTAKLVE